jgi:dihydroorotase
MALKRYPGFIDAHVHLREPGATHKEDFGTGSRAAVKGGFTLVLDMPNNPVPTISPERIEEKVALAKSKGICDIGFHYGTDGENLSSLPYAWSHESVFGLKIYCNHTTGTLLVDQETTLEKIVAAWLSDKPILVHAEAQKADLMVQLATSYGRRLHICHISTALELDLVRSAKKRGIPVTCGVTPHHLFLKQADIERLGTFARVKPPMTSREDQDALWEGVGDGTIDIVESDHAPHTKEEKSGEHPPYGMPGLESTVGLLGKAVHENRLVESDVIRLLFESPKKIFHIPDQPNTYVELDFDRPFVVGSGGYETKCGWSPFDGWEAYGRVETVHKGNNILLQAGEIL